MSRPEEVGREGFASQLLRWLERAAPIYARVALGAAFLSGVADRFGLWADGYGDFAGFLRYTAKVNSFMPPSSIPFLGWAATVAEFSLGVALIIGVRLRLVALASASLLILFGTTMAISFGIKSPLDYSVFSASAAAVLLAMHRTGGARERPEQQNVEGV